MHGSNRSVAIALRLFRALAGAFPQEFKNVYGDELIQAAEDSIEPIWRRHGLAGLLLDLGLDLARGRGARTALLEVRAGNGAALALYRRAGFEVAGRRRDYYRDPPEDALVMRMAGLERRPSRLRKP